MFVPFSNWIGALSGLIFSAILNIWVGLGIASIKINNSNKNYSYFGLLLQAAFCM
jgi:hypothetical protein